MVSHRELLLSHLEDSVPVGGLQVRIRDFFDAHIVHQLQILSLFLLLELVDGSLAVIYRQEMYQFLVVLNILVSDLNSSLQVENIVLLALARLEN